MADNQPNKMIVRAKQCDQCLYTRNKIVSDARRDEIIETCNTTGGPFLCHKGSLVDQDIVCRGHFEANDSLAVRLAKMLDYYEFTLETSGDA